MAGRSLLPEASIKLDKVDTLLEEPGDYPIYRGRNIYQYTHDAAYYDVDPPKYWGVNEGGNQASAKGVIRDREIRTLTHQYPVNTDGNTVTFEDGETIPASDIPMPYEEYRIAYRDIATSSNERTVIATVLPRMFSVSIRSTRSTRIAGGNRGLCQTLRRKQHSSSHGTPQRNSSVYSESSIAHPFDYLLRSKIETHLSDYLITESQAPKPPIESDIVENIWKPAARLNCYGERFQPLRDELDIDVIEEVEARAETQASIDATVFHAYGFEDPEIVWSVLDSLPRVRSPRVLDEAYFDTVINRFEQFRGEF